MKRAQLLDQFRASLSAAPPDEYQQAMREVRPFYWFLLGGIIIQYIFTVYYSPELHKPGRLALFTGLMLLHGILHWLSPHLTYKVVLTLPYVLIQSGIAFALVLVADSIGLSYGLFAPLLGEILGMFRRSKQSILYGLIFLLASFLSYLIVNNMTQAWEWMVTALPIAVFVWLYVFMFTGQVQAREQAQTLLTELEEAHQRLAEYAAQVESLTLTTERQRMARELHDTLAQGLAGLILQLEAADSHLDRGRAEKAHDIVQQAMSRARITLTDARGAIDNLRATQNPADLGQAVREEIERFTASTNIDCSLELCEPDALSPQTAENARRAISEGLTNIARHAAATHVEVTLTCDEQHLDILIRDNGAGFNPEDALGQAGHYGLLGMRERARISGGVLNIESFPARGTTLRLTLPLRPADD